jgi:hypothetical protein
MEIARNKFWLWGHEAGSHDSGYDIPAASRITPVEAALYLGIPKVILVRYEGRPTPPFAQYAVPFRALKEVVWSVVGAGGQTAEEERSQVLALARHLPNLTGVMMDDFFHQPAAGEVGVLSCGELSALRGRLKGLDLWVVLYDHQLGLPVGAHLGLCDKVSFWTWEARNLENLERNFARVEQLAPRCGKVLGCYMWDYGRKLPMPVDLMKHQCELGLGWLRAGRIEGMIFLASCICDLELETVEWTREWIASVGDQPLA